MSFQLRLAFNIIIKGEAVFYFIEWSWVIVKYQTVYLNLIKIFCLLNKKTYNIYYGSLKGIMRIIEMD